MTGSDQKPDEKSIPAKPRILIVDDEPEIRAIIGDLLADHYTSLEAESGLAALSVAKAERPSLILMDIIMPEMDGIEACERLRNDPETRHIPVIMLTAESRREKRIQSFSQGADDFIPKPFDSEELLARIGAKLRRFKERPLKSRHIYGNLRMEKDEQLIWVGNTMVQLTQAEAGILKLLLQNAGDVVSRARIMETVWRGEDADSRVIDAHMTSLRNKIANFRGDINSVYGKGYILVTEE